MSKIIGTKERLRLAVYRSNRHIYAQIIDDEAGRVLVGASSLSGDIKKTKYSNPKERARALGKMIAEKAIQKKVKKVVFDRRKFKYHGSVKELAEGAREGGLEF